MPAKGTIEERFPELFNQTTVDPWTRTRDRKMKVLVIGMMRTGTMCKLPRSPLSGDITNSLHSSHQDGPRRPRHP